MGFGASIDYDQTAGRFVLAHVSRPVNDTVLLCVAVSIDEDAAGQEKTKQRGRKSTAEEEEQEQE